MTDRASPRLKVAAVASAVLCALALVFWLRSMWSGDHVEFGDPPHHLVISHDGLLVFRSISPGGVAGNATGASGWSVLGFGNYTITYARGAHHSWTMPYWFLVLATAAWPVWWFRRMRRERLPERGFEVAATGTPAPPAKDNPGAALDGTPGREER